jgi:hypothetical protein
VAVTPEKPPLAQNQEFVRADELLRLSLNLVEPLLQRQDLHVQVSMPPALPPARGSRSMCVTTASTKYTEFTSLWSATANETGLKDYKAQVSAREYTIDYFKNEINALVEDEIDTFSL